MTDEREVPAKSKGPMILIGCVGCLGLIALVVGVFVVLNLGGIQSTFESARAGVQEVFEVQSALEEEFAASSVRVNMSRELDDEAWSLNVEVSELDLGGEEPETVAREIATLAAKTLHDPDRFGRIEVRFDGGPSGGFIRIHTGRSHEFETSDLLSNELTE